MRRLTVFILVGWEGSLLEAPISQRLGRSDLAWSALAVRGITVSFDIDFVAFDMCYDKLRMSLGVALSDTNMNTMI